MGSDPGFNFLADNFMGATYLWTDAETGQYIRGLCLQKLNGHLSFDDLNTVVKGNQKILAKFIKDEKGLYFNERLQKEIDKRVHHSQLQRDRINKRWNKSDTTVLPGNQSGNTCNETDIETDIVIDLEVKEGMQGENPPELSPDETLFESFRKEYPGTKRGLKTEYDNFRKKHGDHKTVLPLLSTALSNQKQWRVEMSTAGMFVPEWPGLAVWINQRRWENEKPVIENKKNTAIPQCDFQRKAVGKYDNLPKASN